MIDYPLPFGGLFAAEADPTLPLAFVGLPCDQASSIRRGTREGPARIRLAWNKDLARGIKSQLQFGRPDISPHGGLAALKTMFGS